MATQHVAGGRAGAARGRQRHGGHPGVYEKKPNFKEEGGQYQGWPPPSYFPRGRRRGVGREELPPSQRVPPPLGWVPPHTVLAREGGERAENLPLPPRSLAPPSSPLVPIQAWGHLWHRCCLQQRRGPSHRKGVGATSAYSLLNVCWYFRSRIIYINLKIVNKHTDNVWLN